MRELSHDVSLPAICPTYQIVPAIPGEPTLQLEVI
jgi:hypothetical protein